VAVRVEEGHQRFFDSHRREEKRPSPRFIEFKKYRNIPCLLFWQGCPDFKTGEDVTSMDISA